MQIHTSFESSDRTYGGPRVFTDLISWGHACSENRVARLMRRAGIVARRRRRLPVDQGARAEAPIAANLLARDFAAPNQRWVADFAYL